MGVSPSALLQEEQPSATDILCGLGSCWVGRKDAGRSSPSPVNSGGLEAVAVSLQEAEICSGNLYSAIVCSA